jgi:hypothetical protein
VRRQTLCARSVDAIEEGVLPFRLGFESDREVFVQLHEFSNHHEIERTICVRRASTVFDEIRRALFDRLRERSAQSRSRFQQHSFAKAPVPSCAGAIFDFCAQNGVASGLGGEMDGSSRETNISGLLQGARCKASLRQCLHWRFGADILLFSTHSSLPLQSVGLLRECRILYQRTNFACSAFG